MRSPLSSASSAAISSSESSKSKSFAFSSIRAGVVERASTAQPRCSEWRSETWLGLGLGLGPGLGLGLGLGLGFGFELRGDLSLLSEDLCALDLQLLKLGSELLVGLLLRLQLLDHFRVRHRCAERRQRLGEETL